MATWSAKLSYRLKIVALGFLTWAVVTVTSWGAGCEPDQCARLLVVPRTGQVFLDGRRETAPIWAFTLQPSANGPSFLFQQFVSPYGNRVSEQVATANFLGDFDPEEIGKKWLSLGFVLPVQPFSSYNSSTFSIASYATTADDDERQMQLRPLMQGNFDSDGDVDSNDLLTFLGGWTGALTEPSGTVDYTRGDMDFDFDVDSADLLLFLEHWTGASGAGRLAVVPEPRTSVWLMMSGPVVWGLSRRVILASAVRRF